MKTLGAIVLRVVLYGVAALLLSQLPLLVTGGKPFANEDAMAAAFFAGAVIGLVHGVRRAWRPPQPPK